MFYANICFLLKISKTSNFNILPITKEKNQAMSNHLFLTTEGTKKHKGFFVALCALCG